MLVNLRPFRVGACRVACLPVVSLRSTTGHFPESLRDENCASSDCCNPKDLAVQACPGGSNVLSNAQCERAQPPTATSGLLIYGLSQKQDYYRNPERERVEAYRSSRTYRVTKSNSPQAQRKVENQRKLRFSYRNGAAMNPRRRASWCNRTPENASTSPVPDAGFATEGNQGWSENCHQRWVASIEGVTSIR